MTILDYYQSALLNGLKPALLQFQHPHKKTPLSICGIAPLYTLHVAHGKLYKDNQSIGSALDIFKYLECVQSKHFFPAFIGFFSYEFSEYFNEPTHLGSRSFPDAYFRYYDKGLVIDDGIIIHHDETASLALDPYPPVQIQHLSAGINKIEFLRAVDTIKDIIKMGDVYQVNLSMPFFFDTSLSPLALYKAMLESNPSPYMGLIEHDDWALICGSPERLFSLVNNHLTTRPIAGTKKRGKDSAEDEIICTELRSCPKENAEHAMLVDLMRNDMHKVCETEVHIDEDRSVEFYSHVMHLVSQLSGICLKPLGDVFAALFPGGTITGAPKLSVMKCIADLESTPRGPYTGSLGYSSSGFGSDFNIIIRSIIKTINTTYINSGAGIVIDSIPENEWHEINRKAAFVRDILQNKINKKSPKKSQFSRSLKQKFLIQLIHSDKKVLFIENKDSFSFNIIASLRSLGVEVIITDLDSPPDLSNITHVVVGPGPGNPEHLPHLRQIIGHVLQKQKPLLGICLGHQAIGNYFGSTISKHLPIHGQSMPISHFQRGLFTGLVSPTYFTRYHSLVVSSVPAGFKVDAFSEDDCIMAMSHESLPIFGVQFHPESYLSDHKNSIMNNFLETTWPR